VIGRFSFVSDAEGNLIQQQMGTGQRIDVCELLSINDGGPAIVFAAGPFKNDSHRPGQGRPNTDIRAVRMQRR
jgi:hypothetical protein